MNPNHHPSTAVPEQAAATTNTCAGVSRSLMVLPHGSRSCSQVTCATGQPAAGVQGARRGGGGAQAGPGIRCAAAAVGQLGPLGLPVVGGQEAGVRAQPAL